MKKINFTLVFNKKLYLLLFSLLAISIMCLSQNEIQVNNNDIKAYLPSIDNKISIGSTKRLYFGNAEIEKDENNPDKLGSYEVEILSEQGNTVPGDSLKIETGNYRQKLMIKLEIENTNKLLGKHYIIVKKDKTLFGEYPIYIGMKGEPNIQIPDIPQLYCGDNFNMKIQGENLESLNKLSIKDIAVKNFKFTHIDDNNISVSFDIIDTPKNNDKELIFRLEYEKSTSISQSETLSKEFQSSNIIKSPPWKNIQFEPNKLFEKQTKQSIVIIGTIDGSTDKIDELELNSENVIGSNSKIDFLEKNRFEAYMEFSNNLSRGEKKIYLQDKNKTIKFRGKISILPDPCINDISGGINESMQINPYNQEKIIILKGKSLNEVDLELDNKNLDGLIELKQKQNESTANRLPIELIINEEQKKLKIIGKKTRLNLVDKKSKEILGQSKIIEFIAPRNPQTISKMVFLDYNEQNKGDIKEQSNNKGQNEENKDDFKKLSECKFIKKSQFNSVELIIDPSKIKEKNGEQALEITARVFNERGDLVETAEIKDMDSTPEIINVKPRKNSGTDNLLRWNLSKVFDRKIQAWDRIEITFSPLKSFYINEYDQRIPTPERYDILIKGDFWDRLSITPSLPPALCIWNAFKKESKSEDDSNTQDEEEKAQLAVFNAGFGLKFEPRDKNGNLKKWAIGVYFAGLDIFGKENEEEGESNPPSTETRKTKIIKKGDLGLLGVGELKIWTISRNLQIPLQFGFGIRFNRGSRVFVVIGLGLTF